MQPQDQTSDQSLNNSSTASADNSYMPPPLPPELTPLEDTKPTVQDSTNQSQTNTTPKLGAQNEGVVAPSVQATPVAVDKPQTTSTPKISNHSAIPQVTTPQPIPTEPKPIPPAQPEVTSGPPKFNAPTSPAKQPAPTVLTTPPINQPLNKASDEPKIEPVLKPAEPIVDTPADIIKSAKPSSGGVKYIEPVLAPDPNKFQ